MADKEASIFIVDVSRSMGKKHNGREKTDLDWAMTYVWDKITTAMAGGRKTLHFGVVGLRTDGTDNPLSDDEGYANISVFQSPKQCLMPDIRALHEKIKPSNVNQGDPISALVLATYMMGEHTRKLKYIRRIYLITNGCGPMDTDEIAEIAGKINEDNIELLILGVDFDDPEFGFKEENKDKVKAENEAILRSLAENCNGVFATMADVISNINIPATRDVRPVPSFKGDLTLGDVENYESAMSIDVERYPRVRVARPLIASEFVRRSNVGPTEDSAQSSHTLGRDGDDAHLANPSHGLVSAKNNPTYTVEDSQAPSGKREVERSELDKGYEYGSTVCHVSEYEMNLFKFENRKGLEIVGFVDRNKYKRFFHMSETNMIVASRINEKAKLALSSFIHALHELETYAVARLVVKDGNNPVIVLLAPEIEDENECLVDVELPFAEDLRDYKFPPLDRIITISGKKLVEHRYLPSDDLMNAMSDYVDSMDISTFAKDEEGNPCEYAALDDIYSPIVHRVQKTLQFRAVNTTEEIPPPASILTKYSQPPEGLIQQAQPYLQKVLAAANVKKVSPKQKGRKRARSVDKPLSGLDVGALLAQPSNKRTKISAENAIPEFKQLLATTEDITTIKDAAQQLAGIAADYIRHSLGDSGYGRAIEALRVLREEMTELEEPGVWNGILIDLKEKIVKGKLGGDRKEMWWRIRANRLGLVDKRVSEFSGVSEEEAKAFLTARLP
ncbi:SPOC like C-terminal domain-containing protein [Lineolata rhizophorae]|uniref:ATP-dependent DNA helicase II subunit 2 n=1 Tax=Lineolata rhizophorae TaxID=578093 RepID=A0A6A6NW95_9PEZI|nr:SPOC like C-terminal domain-containing protein [Lineolata rhizophorae]